MSERQQNINDQLKTKIDEMDLETKITQVKEQAGKAFQQVKEQAGSLLHDNREKVDGLIEKATTAIDEKTEGKYHDKVTKAKASFASGLDKIEDSRTGGSEDAPDYASPGHQGDEGHVGQESETAAPSVDEPVAPLVDEPVAPSVDEPVAPLGEDPTAWSSETDKLS